MSLLLFVSTGILVLFLLPIIAHPAIGDGSSLAESNTVAITIDSHPRVSSIIIDGIVYIPEQQPVTFGWAIGSKHELEIPEEIAYEGVGTRYIFTQWNDQTTDNRSQLTVTKDMADGNRKFIALFDKQYFLNVIAYGFPIEGSGWYSEGERVKLSVDPYNSQFMPDPNYRRIFTGWSIGLTPNDYENFVIMTGPLDVIATWREEFRVQVKNVLENEGGSGWYLRDSTGTLFAHDSVELNGTKYEFSSWKATGIKDPNDIGAPADTTNSINEPTAAHTTFKVDGAYVIIASWDRLYKLTINSNFGNPEGEGYYTEGALATVSITNPEWELEPDKVRLVFAGWKDYSGKLENLGNSTTITVRMKAPMILEPVWIKQYNLRIQSEYGMVTGSGWYDEGSIAMIGITDPVANIGLGKSVTFQGWSSDEPVNISRIDQTTSAIMGLDRSNTLTADWSVDETFRYVIIGDMIAAAAISGFLLLRIKTRIVKARV